MPRIRFMDPSRNLAIATTAVLTASSSAAGLPVSGIQHQDRTRVWRSTSGTGTPTIDIDLAAAQNVTAVCVANVKLVGSGVLEVYQRGSAGSPGAATLVGTLPTQDAETRATFLFFNTVSARHWQLKWTNPSVATDYAELGFLHLGTYFEPTQNVIVPTEATRKDPSVLSSSVDGQVTVRRRTQYSDGAWVFQEVPEAQLDTYRAMWNAMGVGGVFFQVLDTSLAWTCWLARVSGDFKKQFASLSGRYNVGLPWEEVR